MTSITLPGLNKALDDVVQALEAVGDLGGLIEGWAAFALAVSQARFDDPREESAAIRVGRVYSSMAVAARAVLDQRTTTTHPLPAPTEGK